MRHSRGLRKLSRTSAVAPHRVWPCGQLQEPPCLGSLTSQGEAESSPPRTSKKKIEDAAEFAHRLQPRLRIITAVASQGRPVRLWFQDEARFGLHLPRYRRLTTFGRKPRQPFAPLYESVRVLVAVRSGRTVKRRESVSAIAGTR